MMNQFNTQATIQFLIQYSVGTVSDAITSELKNWQKENKVERLWAGDASLWTNNDEDKWMGWLNVPELELKEIPRIEALAKEIKEAGFKHIVLLGMGGSSLSSAMMAKTFGVIANNPRLHVLDSTDPLQIRHLEDKLDLNKTIFIVASKSGSTLEPNIFKEYFYARLQAVLGKSDVGDRFIAITDPGTALETIAKADHFKAIFYGVPSIGGRYSALSNFGMVPSGLMGIDIKDFLRCADEMVQACLPNVLPKDNPGVLLGVILGICAKQGKDKITLIASPSIQDLGAWLEQLLAESTGKHGKGLIPVDQEALGSPDVYAHDRVFVYIRLEDASDVEQDHAVAAIERAGYVVVRLHLSNKKYLGAELFRWEIATAVAGSIIGIDAFNQPDVEASKIRALQLTAEYEQTRKIPQPNLIFTGDGLQLFTDEINAREITELMVGTPSIEVYLRAHLNRVKQGDYVDLSAFIEMSDEHSALLQQSRILIRDAKKVATCLGFGPRFLHSTGQDYKGGPNTGVFLQITADHNDDIQIPDHQYTFGLVIAAQAQADFEVLVKNSRRVLQIHLGKDVRIGLQQLRKFILKGVNS
jgi:transaldolase/glucose-6-phosphate isomerase